MYTQKELAESVFLAATRIVGGQGIITVITNRCISITIIIPI
jgi:hypothetical protein